MARWSVGYIDVLVAVRAAGSEQRFRVEVNPGANFQQEIRPELVAALQLGRPEDFTLHLEGTLTDPVIVLTRIAGAEAQPGNPSPRDHLKPVRALAAANESASGCTAPGLGPATIGRT
jgi:hypothetical protein